MSNRNQERPIYSYLPDELHDFLNEIKICHNINKSEAIQISLFYVRKNLGVEGVAELYKDFILLGTDAL